MAFVDSTNVKGAVAEQAIVLAATKLGVPVLRPVSEHGRSDLALDIGGKLWRVQCKWGRLAAQRDVVIARVGTCRSTPRGYVRTTYSPEEVDLLAVYCGELDRCFLLPVNVVAGLTQIHLRLGPARNGQQACTTLAADFDFDGAVAQLARASGWQPEGRGFESPQLHSTPTKPLTIGSNPFRDRLGYWMDRVAAGEHVVITRHGKARIRLLPAT
jgi:hypothetical protein